MKNKPFNIIINMDRRNHRIFLFSMSFFAVAVFVFLAVLGGKYYSTPIEERFFHLQNEILKPSGIVGHGLGIAGSLFMLIGVFSYMIRKRIRMFQRLGILKHWLEFHIFLCSLGPILVLYHTSFKFGGLVAVSFWSMVAVVFSGIVGRFIYLQIPRTIEGREMTRNEILKLKIDLFSEIENSLDSESQLVTYLNNVLQVKSPDSQGNFFKKIGPQLRYERKILSDITQKLKAENISAKAHKRVIRMVKREIVMSRRIAWLSTMQDFLRYWHVAHLPFALVMLVIMIVHVIVAVLFGYNWIF